MSDKIKDGGAAFPQISELGDIAVLSPGMTLRDWFAGQALSGWLASFGTGEAVNVQNSAEFCYEIADAMLSARNEGAQ